MLRQGWLFFTALLRAVVESLGSIAVESDAAHSSQPAPKQRVLVVEPGSAPALPEDGGCSPWLRQVSITDLLAALVSFDFVALHALPAWRVVDLASDLRRVASDAQSQTHAFVKVPFLPEHPWFSQSGSAAGIVSYGLELLQSEDEVETLVATGDSQLLACLLCVQLFAMLRGAIGAAEDSYEDLRRAVSKGDNLAKRFLSPSKWPDLKRTRWASCIFGTLLGLADLVCSLPGAPQSCTQSSADAPASQVPQLLALNSSLSVRGRFLGLLELSVRGRPLLKNLASQVQVVRDVQWRNFSFELIGQRRPRSLKLASGAVAHVLSVSHGDGYGYYGRSIPVLEFLIFFDTDDGCAEMFTVGSCATLHRAALLAWRCDFARGAGQPRVTSTVGAAASHYGTELILQCPLPAPKHLRVAGGVPRRSANAFQVTLVAQSDAGWTIPPVPISILPRRGPRWRLVGCSAPLYVKQRSHLVLVKQWLEYHRAIGFDHFFVYDLDGSLKAAVQDLVTSGFVTYVPHWPRRLSKTCASLLNEHPRGHVCTQTQAEAHCVWRARGLARWTMLLHSFDAYVSAEAPENVLRKVVQPLLASLEPVRASFAALAVLRFDFSCSPEATSSNCADQQLEDSLRVAGYKWRQRVPQLLQGHHHRGFDLTRDSLFDHGGAVLVNPENVLAMQTHWARGRPGTMHAILPPDMLRLNHYVELLGHGGRCAKQAREGDPPCDLLDDSMLWTTRMRWTKAVDHLRPQAASHQWSAAGIAASASVLSTATSTSLRRGMRLGTAPPCRSITELGRRLLVIVPGHGEQKRAPVLADNLRSLREEAEIETRCLVFVYRSEEYVLRDPDGEIARCQVVRRPGIFLEFLSDPAVRLAARGVDFVLLMLDDIALHSSHRTSASQLMHLMRRNNLDVVSPALLGSHRSYEGMRPVPLRRGAVGRLTNFVEIQMPMFTRSAFEVFRAMIYPNISSTWGHAALYHGTFLKACGRKPRMGIVDTMHMRHTGAWLTSTMDERKVNRQLRALQVFFRLQFNVTPVEERMFLGKLWP